MTPQQEPAMGVSDEMIAAAASAYNSAAVAEGFRSVQPPLGAIHLRWMRAALLAALQHMQPAGEAVEALSESDKDVALGQAVEFAQYVERQAKGAMVDAARKFLSLPYSQEIAARLTTPPQPSAEEAQDTIARVGDPVGFVCGHCGAAHKEEPFLAQIDRKQQEAHGAVAEADHEPTDNPAPDFIEKLRKEVFLAPMKTMFRLTRNEVGTLLNIFPFNTTPPAPVDVPDKVATQRHTPTGGCGRG